MNFRTMKYFLYFFIIICVLVIAGCSIFKSEIKSYNFGRLNLRLYDNNSFKIYSVSDIVTLNLWGSDTHTSVVSKGDYDYAYNKLILSYNDRSNF